MRKKALILGGYGAVGFACAKALAINGYDIVIVCRGRRSKKEEYEQKKKVLEQYGSTVLEINGNAVAQECIDKVCNDLIGEKIHCFIHAIADGNIGNVFVGEKILKQDSYIHTFNSMCVSFACWTQNLFQKSLFANGAHVFGFSSEGLFKTFPLYVANGVAKAGLETLCLYMAKELECFNIYVNIIRAGIMDTNAVRFFGCHADIVRLAKKENPKGKLTEPDVVAEKMIHLLSTNITGGIINAE